MYGSESCGFSLWWMVPIIMILCFFMMRGRRDSMMCGFGSRAVDCKKTEGAGSASDMLDRRYASGEIDKDRYEEKKWTLTESTDSIDALSHYNRYTDIFDYDDVPEAERKEVAQFVAKRVIESLNGKAADHCAVSCETKNKKSSGCCGWNTCNLDGDLYTRKRSSSTLESKIDRCLWHFEGKCSGRFLLNLE
jgi:hypothetical protein